MHLFPQRSMDSCRIQRPPKVFCFQAAYHGALVRRFFMENLQHCQKAGTFRSFEERSGSDAFILFFPSIQECLQRPPIRPQRLQSISFRSTVRSVDHIFLFTALGRWRVADRALRSSPSSTRSPSNEPHCEEREVQSSPTGLKLFSNVCMSQYCSH